MNMSHRGRALSISEKQMVVHVKHYFDKEKELFLTNKKIDVNNSAFRTALATNLSQVTVWRIMAEYNSNDSFSPPVKKGSRTYAINENVKTICQDIIRSHRAQLLVRGQCQIEQGLKASVDPGEPEMHEVVETVLTPPHPDPFETLLDEPLTGTFDHPRPQRQSQFLVCSIVDVIPVPLQIRIHRRQGGPRRVGQPLHVQGVGEVGQHPVGIAMP